MTVHHVRTLHGSGPNMSDRDRLILFYECHAGDAWPLLGAGSYIQSLGQRLLWQDLHERVITGRVCLTPRLEKVPARMPLPPAPDASSIFKSQKSRWRQECLRASPPGVATSVHRRHARRCDGRRRARAISFPRRSRTALFPANRQQALLYFVRLLEPAGQVNHLPFRELAGNGAPQNHSLITQEAARLRDKALLCRIDGPGS